MEMKNSAMNSPERVFAALRRQQPDRVPALEFVVDNKVARVAAPGCEPDAANLLSGSRAILSADGGETWDFGYDIVQRGGLTPCADGSLAGLAGRLLPIPGGHYQRFCADYVRYEAGGRRYVREPQAAVIEGLPRPVKPHQLEGTLGRQWPADIGLGQGEVSIGGEALALANLTFEGDTLYTTALFSSRDEGRSWQFRSIVAGPASWPGMLEGPCEGTLVQLANGDLMAVMRVGSSGDEMAVLQMGSGKMIRVYSQDQGYTWSTADQLPAWSVAPCARRLSNDVLALSTGRPRIYLWLSTDERGAAWQSIDIMAHHNAVFCLPLARRQVTPLA